MYRFIISHKNKMQLKVQGVKRRLYSITISAQQRKINIEKEHIDEVITYLTDQDVLLVNGVYEIGGKYHQLHYHGIAWLPQGFRWIAHKQYGDVTVMHRTFRIQWKAIRTGADATRWLQYLNKEVRNKYEQ